MEKEEFKNRHNSGDLVSGLSLNRKSGLLRFPDTECSLCQTIVLFVSEAAYFEPTKHCRK